MSVKVCPRHGTVLHQVRDRHLKGGVRLRCRDCKALSDARYRGSEEGRETRREWKRERRARSRLPYLMQTLSLLDRKTAALVQKAADDRETANPYEKKMALRILIRKGQI